ncbi:MAG: universal stress protein [Alphaproteobacteria bacterium]
MYKRLLIPLDGSKNAENVLPYARLLAAKLNLPAELLSVVETPVSAAAERALYFDAIIERAVDVSREYLNRIAKSLDGISVTIAIEKGNPEEIILERAEADENTLIAMATHGRSGIARWLLGSIAEKVVRQAKNPLFLVRAKEEAKKTQGQAALNPIVVPLDGSEVAEAILPHVIELAKSIKLKVVLLQAFTLKQIISTYKDYIPDFDALERSSKSGASRYLQEKERQLKEAGLDVSVVAAEGDAAETIIELAKGSPDSLIAMCTHGHSGIRRWMLGSTTEKVVRHADNPLLIVRAK